MDNPRGRSPISPLTMSETLYWPNNYFDSRRQFLELANNCGAKTESHWIKPTGPGGEPLSVDVAALTSDSDEHRIILTSGVHGVEGFIGASVQMQSLQTLATKVRPNRIGVVMIHAANPWGFAHLRRVDENNVDINRNFIDFDVNQAITHPKYHTLDPVINTPKKPGTWIELQYWLKTGKLIVQHGGIKKLAEPIATGQSGYPKGVFYTGCKTSQSTALLQEIVHHHSNKIEQISILDVHSGLGPSGVATLIANSNVVDNETLVELLHNHYEQAVMLSHSSSNPYNAQGTLSEWLDTAMSEKRFVFLCVEIGTVHPVKLFSALRRENQAHHWSDQNSKLYNKTKQSLLDVFSPRSVQWRNSAVAQGFHTFNKTFELPPLFNGK